VSSESDREHMLRAVALAEKGRHTAHPNPLVGCVVVDVSGTVVGEGFHRRPGEAHAEAIALDNAKERARGGTLYLTLEPCAHQGRTPPCVDQVISSGVARVVVALEDPDPRVQGAGIAAAKAARIDVTVGVAAREARRQNIDYLHHRRTGRPWVVLKSAVSVDGLWAAMDGSSRWITNEESRADAQRMRAEADAVMVGSGTVLADDPALTCRLPGYEGSQPLRVVMDRRHRVPASAACRGPGSVVLDGTLKEALDDLGRRGVVRLLVEGGPTLATALVSEGLVDCHVVYMAPLALAGAPAVAAGRRLQLLDVARLGDDVRLSYELGEHEEEG
jgi:diaminohydroxyphosphoribosylaminopyrimidine deaminase / 5-amino-6-(5-phosphoribosylamino)uracil reductase